MTSTQHQQQPLQPLQPPSTPVRVPKSVASYSPTTEDPDIRSDINGVLLQDGHILRIHEALTHALYADPSNWPSKIHNHALTLLRSGECTTFPELMRRVLQDVRRDSSGSTSTASNGANGNGSAHGTKENGAGKGREESTPPPPAETANGIAQAIASGKGKLGEDSLAVPRAVVDEGLKVTRECLELVCEIED